MAALAHETLLGLRKAEAGSELVWTKSKKHAEMIQNQTLESEETDETTVPDGRRGEEQRAGIVGRVHDSSHA